MKWQYRLRYLTHLLLGRLEEAMQVAIAAEKRFGPGTLNVSGREAHMVRAGLSAARLLKDTPPRPQIPLPPLPGNVVDIRSKVLKYN